MNNNFRFSDSELINDEVDDMKECVDHFEAAESSFPVSGRTLSDNELSEVLGLLEGKTTFSTKRDNDKEEDLLIIHVPVLRKRLVSAEIEQELCFAWGLPFHISFSGDWFDQWTEYTSSAATTTATTPLSMVSRRDSASSTPASDSA